MSISKKWAVRAVVVAAAAAGALGLAAGPAAALPTPNKWTQPAEAVPISQPFSSQPFSLVPISQPFSAGADVSLL